MKTAVCKTRLFAGQTVNGRVVIKYIHRPDTDWVQRRLFTRPISMSEFACHFVVLW